MNQDFFVTGGAQGLGYQFARKILGGGGRVFIGDIDEERGTTTRLELEEQFGQGKVGFAKLDVTNEDEWKSTWDAAEKFFGGQVQGFCNNAGIFGTNWSLMNKINLDGMLFGAMLAYQRMGVSHGGSGGLMVITGSGASFICGWNTMEESVYNVTKHGVQGLVRSQAANSACYNRDKVRTMAICPTFVDTQLVRNVTDNYNKLEKKYGFRVLEPEEVGDTFEQLVAVGKSGDMVVVLPGVSFMWPNWNRQLAKVFVVATKLAKMLFGLSEGDIVTSREMGLVGLVLLLLAALLFHFLLSWLGF